MQSERKNTVQKQVRKVTNNALALFRRPYSHEIWCTTQLQMKWNYPLQILKVFEESSPYVA